MSERQVLEVKILSAKLMAELGCAVSPIRPGQTPNINKATKDPDLVERYLRAHPTYNYVVPTGKRSGVFVVTVSGEKGAANFARILEPDKRLPTTMVVSRGEETDIYFQRPEDFGIPNCKIAEGVEVRGDGNFVAGAGSKGSDGKINAFAFDFCDRELRIHTAPRWLLEKINSAETTRLAQLSEIDYERERDAAAKRLNIRKSVLDDQVERARKASRIDPTNEDVSLCERTLWPEPVDGATLLSDLTNAVLRYVVMPQHVAQAIALWVVHTYALLAFSFTPRLAIKSPLPECGKSTLLDVLACLVCRPLATANITAAAIFRIVDAKSPALLIDEADTFLIKSDDIRGILNSGHRRTSAHIVRVEGEKNLKPRVFDTFAAAAIAAIGSLPDTIEDRSIQVNLKRKRPDEEIERFDLNEVSHLTELASKAARWASDHLARLKNAKTLVPATLVNREADNWRPLLAIADAAGGEWPVNIRWAAQTMTASARNHEVSVQILLLQDIRAAFVESKRKLLPSARLVEMLIGMEGHPWGEWRGSQPLTPNALARLLRSFDIHPIELRIGNQVLRGYKSNQFADAFSRYLAAP
jgi:putative DNA primase/helicase